MLFVIADLHLSLSVNKPMDIFGGWDDYMERLKKSWKEKVSSEDTVVIPGDISWAMNFEQARADFELLNQLPGLKIILKGNHDYWWSTVSKINKFLAENGFNSIKILHNNHYAYGEYGICGTRGWINETEEPADAKVLAREVGRLEASVSSAVKKGLTPIVFLHYPPAYGGEYNRGIMEVLHRYHVKQCFYGHLHGANSHKKALRGEHDGINFELIASDYVQFIPKQVF
ncbi:MAG: metallophosphoesterase [Oscillospiraceae bacterium]|nr:metallophosphoesterase [Oscillospiraceae bacterium]